MAGRFTMPAKEAAAGAGTRGNAVFPEGAYLVTLENVRNSELRDWHTAIPQPRQNRDGEMYQPRPQVASDQADFVSLRFGQGQPLTEESSDPGNLKLFQELVLRDGEATITQDNEGLDHGWLIARSQRVALNLALALNSAVENGEGVYLPDNFADHLKSGGFDGQQVIAHVNHRRYHTRDQRNSQAFKNNPDSVEPEGVSVEISRFQAVGGA